MRFRLTLLMLVIFATTAFAAPVSMGPATHTDYEFDCNRDAFWCQAFDPDGGATASQEDVVYPFEAWTADDFVAPCDGTVDQVQWWGGHWNYVTLTLPDYFIITFWDDVNCTPGSELASEVVYTYTATEVGTDTYEYIADVTPFSMTAGTTYWLTIQAGLLFDPAGQWGWIPTIDPDQGCVSLQMFPLLGMDVWTDHTNGDMAFCLFGDVVTAAEETSLSTIKSLY
ncbi:MAG: hypothetical protein GY835_10680 [bacterium]|nr:hypothetical protein [bacterium]